MWHRKFDRQGSLIEGCGGRVFIDRAFSNDSWVETICVKCGKRWLLDAMKNAFARKLVKIERSFVNAK